MAKRPAVTPLDPKRIFDLAEAFRESVPLMVAPLMEGAVQDGHLKRSQPIPLEQVHRMMPSLVVQAFAIELYLKCLQCIEKGTTHGRHDFLKLYQNLSPASRAKIKVLYDADVATVIPIVSRLAKTPPNFDLLVALARCADTFEVQRYCYEQPIGSFEGFEVTSVLEAIRTVIRDFKPAWV